MDKILSLISSESDRELLQQWFDNLSPRDQVIASLRADEIFSQRTLELQRKYSTYKQSIPPCSHCESFEHGLLHCDKRNQYPGFWTEEKIQEQRELDEILFIEGDCIRTLLRTIDKLIKIKKSSYSVESVVKISSNNGCSIMLLVISHS